MKNITYLLYFLAISCTFTAFSQSTATYTITFNSDWNASDHGTLPGDAHWSRLVGANHTSAISYWDIGLPASLGIENIAEIGSNSAFNSEVQTNINNGNTEQYIDGSNLNSAQGSIVIEDLEISDAYPLLTLATMIAPSPDWFIGINNVSLVDDMGNWKSTITMDMYVYDAGTEEGATYSYNNAPTNPQSVISSKINVAPFNNQRVGTLTINLQSVLSTNTETLANIKMKLFPNPSSGIITISSPNTDAIKEIAIYNIVGKRMYANNNFKKGIPVTLNLNHLNKGMYVVKSVLESGNTTSRKLILQ